MINAHAYGNGNAIFTRDGNAAREFAHRIKVGFPVIRRMEDFALWRSPHARPGRDPILYSTEDRDYTLAKQRERRCRVYADNRIEDRARTIRAKQLGRNQVPYTRPKDRPSGDRLQSGASRQANPLPSATSAGRRLANFPWNLFVREGHWSSTQRLTMSPRYGKLPVLPYRIAMRPRGPEIRQVGKCLGYN
jgi:hypothetical protein